MRRIGDRETLLQIATTWGDFPIKTIEKASDFLQLLHDKTGGCVIFDFLDAANWDCFESHSINTERGILQINWHDFIEQDNQDPRSEDRDNAAMVFPASLYAMAMRFNCIERVGTEKVAWFALRGYALTDKEARQALSSGTEGFFIRQDRPFSREVIRKVDGHFEVIDCITSAAFTVLIVPKGLHSAHASSALLYYHNLAEIDASLGRCEKALTDIDENDVEAICEKANTTRRSMETLLKLECCFRRIETPKPYSQARLGDLWGLLKAYHKDDVRTRMSQFLQWANELSHDTGIPVEKSKAQQIALLARKYYTLLKQQVQLEYR